MKSTRMFALILVLILILGLIVQLSCGDDDDDDDDTASDDDDNGDDDDSAGGFELASTTFEDNGTIPTKSSCDNDNPDQGLSPQLSWTGAPEGTAYFALTCIDVSTDPETVHWAVVHIPAEVSSLDEGAGTPNEGDMPEESTSFEAYTGDFGYAGPCPPEDSDPHSYVFTLYAMSEPLAPSATESTQWDDVKDAVEAVTLEKASITGTFAH